MNALRKSITIGAVVATFILGWLMTKSEKRARFEKSRFETNSTLTN